MILTFIISSFKLDSLLHYSAEIGTLLEVRCVIYLGHHVDRGQNVIYM